MNLYETFTLIESLALKHIYQIKKNKQFNYHIKKKFTYSVFSKIKNRKILFIITEYL